MDCYKILIQDEIMGQDTVMGFIDGCQKAMELVDLLTDAGFVCTIFKCNSCDKEDAEEEKE